MDPAQREHVEEIADCPVPTGARSSGPPRQDEPGRTARGGQGDLRTHGRGTSRALSIDPAIVVPRENPKGHAPPEGPRAPTPLPVEFWYSLPKRFEMLSTKQRQLLGTLAQCALRGPDARGTATLQTIQTQHKRTPEGELFYRLEHLRLLGFISILEVPKTCTPSHLPAMNSWAESFSSLSHFRPSTDADLPNQQPEFLVMSQTIRITTARNRTVPMTRPAFGSVAAAGG